MADISGLIEWEASLKSESPVAEVTSVPAQLWKHPEEATREQLLFMHTRLLARSVKEAKKSAEANRRREELEEKVHRAKINIGYAEFYLGYAMQNGILGILGKVANYLKRAREHLSA